MFTVFTIFVCGIISIGLGLFLGREGMPKLALTCWIMGAVFSVYMLFLLGQS